MLLSLRAQRRLTFVSGFRPAFWCSRSQHIRSPFAASRDQIHHRFRFCCDSFFTWIFLCSFRHHFKTIGRTEMANVKQTQKDDSIHHVWSFPLSVCLRVGFWCQCIWFGFWGPNWFDRTTNQEQLCGFWKHVSLSGFFPWWSSWSLLRCPQTQATKLLDAKIGRLREHNQCDPTRWSFLEIFDLYHWQRVSTVFQESELCFQEQKQLDPIFQSRQPV